MGSAALAAARTSYAGHAAARTATTSTGARRGGADDYLVTFLQISVQRLHELGHGVVGDPGLNLDRLERLVGHQLPDDCDVAGRLVARRAAHHAAAGDGTTLSHLTSTALTTRTALATG